MDSDLADDAPGCSAVTLKACDTEAKAGSQ